MSKKVHVFNAGPCLLPQVAIDHTIEALKDFSGTGVSLLSISHRTKEWDAVMDECRALWKELLHIPDTHEVVFLGGGASLQFLYVAMNYLEKKAAYLDTGVWAHKALVEAQGIGEAYAIACSKDKNYSYIPKGFEIPADLDYLHITTNNTIYGTEIKKDMDCPCPLIAETRHLPTMLNYQTHIDKLSMFNTPPVFAIYVMNETLKWIKSVGGVEAIQKINEKKAQLLYDEIDRNSLFTGTAAKEDRSLMNVCFVMAPGKEELQDEFFAFAKERGMVGIKGHRSVGGFRASLYNACPIESVQALVDCMKEFEALKK